MSRRLLTATLVFLCSGPLAQAATVFLNPPEPVLPPRLSPQQAHLVLSNHLGVEQFEVLDQQQEVSTGQWWALDQLFRGEREFVAQGSGQQSALLLFVDEAFVRDILPSTLKPSFSFPESPTDALPSSSSWSSLLLAKYAHRASHVYTHVFSSASPSSRGGTPRTLDIFSAPTPANEAFLADASVLVSFVDEVANANTADPSRSSSAPDRRFFAVLELVAGVRKLAETYGRSSEAYRVAVDTVRVAIERVMASQEEEGKVRLAVVAYAAGSGGGGGGGSLRRGSSLEAASREGGGVVAAPGSGSPPPFGEPLTSESRPPVKMSSSPSTCYGSYVECADATDGCSDHGVCTNATRATGQVCFVCQCKTTRSDTGKVQNWAGEMCQRKDVSGPFVLIAGTVITLILLMGGAVSLLYTMDGQELPSILIGGVSGGVRRE